MNKINQLSLLAIGSAVLFGIYINLGPKEKVGVVRLAQPTIIASLPIWVGEEKGFFKKRNLSIDIELTNKSSNMVETLLAGNVDVLPAVSLVDLAKQTGSGKIPLLEMQIYSHSRMRPNPSFESILVPQGSKYVTLKDLEGKRIAVFPGITSTKAMRHFLQVNRVNASTIKLIELNLPEHEPALLRGDVQAVHIYEPFRSLALSDQKTRELFGSIYAHLSKPSPSAIGASAISRKFTSTRPSEAKRFLEAWDEAIDYIRKHHTESRTILADRLKIDHKIANAATWVDATKTNEINIHNLETTIKTLIEADIVPADFTLENQMIFGR